MDKLANVKNKIQARLHEDREGAEVFEYVLIVAILVALIILMFQFIGPVFMNKMNNIANDVAHSGTGTWGK